MPGLPSQSHDFNASDHIHSEKNENLHRYLTVERESPKKSPQKSPRKSQQDYSNNGSNSTNNKADHFSIGSKVSSLGSS